MARQVDANEADFRRTRSYNGVRWFQEDWKNGEAWELEQGVDFEGKPESARARLHAEASALNMASRVKILPTGNVLFQFYTPTEEQLAKRQAMLDKRAATLAENQATGKTPKRSKKSA